MKIVIAGAGGVGAYYGATLTRAGHDTFFIARGEHLAACRKSGLQVKSINGDFDVTPRFGENSDQFGKADLVIVCFKSYDTTTTFDLYRKSVGPDTMIISLQNGIDNEPTLAEEFGPDNIMGGIAFIGSRVERPGMVLHTAFGHITIGQWPKGKSERANTLGEVFNSAGVKCRVSADIKRDLYKKMIWNVGFNALCAILDCPAKETVDSDHTRWIVRNAMTEWVSVARENGVDLENDLVDQNINVTLKGGEVIPSMLHDKRRGRKMEIETFNGKVVELGKSLKVDTPVNRTLTSLIRFHNKRIERRDQ